MEMGPNATLFGPADPDRPVILSVPHAGRRWTAAMTAALTCDPAALLTLEDRHADRLVDGAVASGFTVLVAHTPRAWIDLNRAPDDLDWPRLTGEPPQPVSARAAAGIGIVPDRLGDIGPLWRAPLSRQEVAARVASIHAPWHAALDQLMARAMSRHGCALLLDVHSMPSPTGRAAADIVLGTRRGQSVGAQWVHESRHALTVRGRRVAIDTPYAGAYVAECHGRPHLGRHVLQLEIDRRLYLNSDATEIGVGLPRAQADVLAVAEALSMGLSRPLAAE